MAELDCRIQVRLDWWYKPILWLMVLTVRLRFLHWVRALDWSLRLSKSATQYRTDGTWRRLCPRI